MRSRKKISKFIRRDKRKVLLFAFPSIIGVLLFFILPFMVIIVYSLSFSPFNLEFVGLDNFKQLLNNLSFKQAVKNTFTFAGISVPLAVILSLLLAIVLDANIPFKSQFRTIFITPLMVPIASIVLIWQVIFHQNGVLNEFTALFGAEAVDWFKSDNSQWVITLLYLWKNVGYNMILFMAALANIPKDILEVAVLDGAGTFRRFFYIKLRYLSSSIVFVTILSLINSFKVFREIYLLTGDYPYTSLYMLQHFMNNIFANLDYPRLSAAAIIMCIFMIIIIGIMFIIDNKVEGSIEE